MIVICPYEYDKGFDDFSNPMGKECHDCPDKECIHNPDPGNALDEDDID
jgi:hypothetical protein